MEWFFRVFSPLSLRTEMCLSYRMKLLNIKYYITFVICCRWKSPKCIYFQLMSLAFINEYARTHTVNMRIVLKTMSKRRIYFSWLSCQENYYALAKNTSICCTISSWMMVIYTGKIKFHFRNLYLAQQMFCSFIAIYIVYTIFIFIFMFIFGDTYLGEARKTLKMFCILCV